MIDVQCYICGWWFVVCGFASSTALGRKMKEQAFDVDKRRMKHISK